MEKSVSRSKEPGSRVTLRGRVTRVGRTHYTPAGVAVLEFEVSILQRDLSGPSTGELEVELSGEGVARYSQFLRIGNAIEISGSLHARRYRDKRGDKARQTKVLADDIRRIDNEK